MFRHNQRAVPAILLCIFLCLAAAGCSGKSGNSSAVSSNTAQTNLQAESPAEKGVKVAVQEVLPSADQSAGGEQWQGKVTFPDWKGYTDDTLAMNHMYSFFGYHGQGSLRICPAGKVTGFSLYVNDVLVNTAELAGGRQGRILLSGTPRANMNCLRKWPAGVKTRR